jgi:hypothetical protein
MPQHQSRPFRAGRGRGERAKLLRVIAGASLLALLVALQAPVARAADDDGTAASSGWTKFLQFMGVKPSSGPNISYTERAPLVVPPSRDLPPPADNAALPAPDWPKDPNQQHPKTEKKAKAGVVPGTAVQTPNPTVVKKPWYNPTGWFDKEEYANFNGEPVRQTLTDPPAGYRVPSAEQPYGIPREKDKGKTAPTGADLGYGKIGGGQ